MQDLHVAHAVRSPKELARLEGDDALRARKLREAAGAFEAMFVKMLLENMRRSTEEGFFGDSFSGEIHESLFEEELSKSLADTGALGIADVLYRQMAPAAGLAETPPRAAADAYRRAGGRSLAPVDLNHTNEDGSAE